MTKFFNKFNFFQPIFGTKYFFSSRNPAQSRTTSNGFLTPRQNLEKPNDRIPKNVQADRWVNKQMEG